MTNFVWKNGEIGHSKFLPGKSKFFVEISYNNRDFS